LVFDETLEACWLEPVKKRNFVGAEITLLEKKYFTTKCAKTVQLTYGGS
jgi:hypothetical protein